MKRKEYEKALRKLQVELCALQDWVKQEGLRVVVIFEGRDAAGKGGTIKAITERVSPACSGWWRCRRRPIAKRGNYTSAALFVALSDRGRDRDLRPQLVQPGRCRIRNGLLYEGAASPLPPGLP